MLVPEPMLLSLSVVKHGRGFLHHVERCLSEHMQSYSDDSVPGKISYLVCTGYVVLVFRVS